jgi:hypothetical protein
MWTRVIVQLFMVGYILIDFDFFSNFNLRLMCRHFGKIVFESYIRSQKHD